MLGVDSSLHGTLSSLTPTGLQSGMHCFRLHVCGAPGEVLEYVHYSLTLARGGARL